MRTDGGGQWLPALPANASGAAKWLVTQPKLEAEEEEEAEAEGAGASVRHVLGDARHVLEGEAYFYSQQDFNFFYYPFDKQVRDRVRVRVRVRVRFRVRFNLSYYPFDKQVLKHGSEYVAGSTRSFSDYP